MEGQNLGGYKFIVQCFSKVPVKVKSESEVAQLCPTLIEPMDCSLPGFSIHGIFQATVLEWGAIAFSPSCLQSFPKSESFQMSQLFASGGQNIGVSASTSVLPMNQFSSVQSLSHV